MIVKIFKAGKSFKSLAAYLLHDVKNRESKERVDWTESRNCTFDDPDSAIHEMLWTYRAAEELKHAAGIKAGGRKLENPVRHISLNWHPSERPTREQMLEAVDSFLQHMGWHDHQALLVRHKDREHAHVHIILNAVHPETGLALDSSLEKRRAQKWAKEYEREHQLVWCEERLKPQEERTPSPTRKSWEILRNHQQQHDRTEVERVAGDGFFSLSPEEQKDKEWQALKAQQRHEREQFFMDGKEAYRDARNGVFREVRTEFRDDWRLYYAARRAGVDQATVVEVKEGILADQNAILKERGDAACTQLRDERDRQYEALLERQQQAREELRLAQERGEHSYELLDALYSPLSPIEAPEREREGSNAGGLGREFREANAEITGVPLDDRAGFREEPEISGNDAGGGAPARDGLDAAGALGEGMFKILASIAESLSGGHTRQRPLPADRGPSLSEEERERARRAAELKARAEEQDREAAVIKAFWEDRRERQRERD